MELRNLRHVVALARCCNYIKASEELGLSQSALTRSIQTTERQLGVRLFDRDRGGVHLTQAGSVFVERARALLAEADNLQTVMKQTSSAEEGTVCFGIESLPARALLPATLAGSIKDAPNLRTHVLIRSIEALWGLLTSGDIEFFVSAEGRVPENAQTQVTRLGSFPLSLLVRSGHPALSSPAKGASFPLLLSGEAGDFASLPADLRPWVMGPRHIIEDYDLLGKITHSSDAVLVSSSIAMEAEIREGHLVELHSKTRRGAILIPIAMYHLTRRTLSPGADRLKTALIRQMRDIPR